MPNLLDIFPGLDPTNAALVAGKLSLGGGDLTGDLSVDGKIGIGNSSPTYPLDIAKSTGSAYMRLGRTYTGSESNILFGAESSRNLIQSRSGTGNAAQRIDFLIGATQRFSLGTAGQIGLSSTNYGTNGQVLTSKGSGAAAAWENVSDASILNAVDDRDMKPSTSGVGSTVKGVKPFFTSLGGMTGTANTDYQDVLVLDTYSDTSGGNANALSFDKSTQLIKHWNADQTATTWGTPKTIAYTDSDITGNAATVTNGVYTNTAQTLTGRKTFQTDSDYTIGLNDSTGENEWWLKTYANGNFALHENGVGDQFTIAAGGNVGLGVTDPLYKLEVQGEAGIELYNSTGGGNVLNFRPSLGDANKYNLSISSYDHSGGGSSAADGLSINGYDGVSISTGSGTARQERMRITGTGALSFGSAGTAFGSSGQVLTSTGNTPPTWQAAAAGGPDTITVTGSTGSRVTTIAEGLNLSGVENLGFPSTGGYTMMGISNGSNSIPAGTVVSFHDSDTTENDDSFALDLRSNGDHYWNMHGILTIEETNANRGGSLSVENNISWSGDLSGANATGNMLLGMSNGDSIGASSVFIGASGKVHLHGNSATENLEIHQTGAADIELNAFAGEVQVAGTGITAGTDASPNALGIGADGRLQTVNVSGGGAQTTFVSDNFTANGSTTNFSLVNGSPSSKSLTMVYIQGVYQSKSNYNLVSNQIQFTAGTPAEDDVIEVVSISAVSTVASAVTSVNGNVGAVTVSSKYNVSVISSNTNALANTLYVFTGNLNLTLPASPTSGDSIKISNRSAVETCQLLRNGKNILGSASDLTLDTASSSFELVYTDSTNGWVIIGS